MISFSLCHCWLTCCLRVPFKRKSPFVWGDSVVVRDRALVRPSIHPVRCCSFLKPVLLRSETFRCKSNDHTTCDTFMWINTYPLSIMEWHIYVYKLIIFILYSNCLVSGVKYFRMWRYKYVNFRRLCGGIPSRQIEILKWRWTINLAMRNICSAMDSQRHTSAFATINGNLIPSPLFIGF